MSTRNCCSGGGHFCLLFRCYTKLITEAENVANGWESPLKKGSSVKVVQICSCCCYRTCSVLVYLNCWLLDSLLRLSTGASASIITQALIQLMTGPGRRIAAQIAKGGSPQTNLFYWVGAFILMAGAYTVIGLDARPSHRRAEFLACCAPPPPSTASTSYNR